MGTRRGGIRKGAGRPKATHTLEAEKAKERIVQRVTKEVDALMDAQISLAKGISYVYRIDEEKNADGKIKREHVIVTDPDEIREFLDEHSGENGTVNDTYYYITTEKPENPALESLLNRAYGKPKESVEHTGEVILKLDA